MKYINFLKNKPPAKFINPAELFNEHESLVNLHTSYEVIAKDIAMNWRPFLMNTRAASGKLSKPKFIQLLNKKVHLRLSDE